MEHLPPLDLAAVKRCLEDGCSLQVRRECVIVYNKNYERAGVTTPQVFIELWDDRIFGQELCPLDNAKYWAAKLAEEVASAG